MTFVLIMLFVLKRLRKLWFVIAFIILVLPANSITISGSEPAYAGKTLEFKTLTDPVSKNEKPVFQLVIDGKGNFSSQVRIDETLYCFSDFGIYRGEMILVPGENIRITLPPFKEKSFEESKNPYFEPVKLWLVVNGGSAQHLTNQISRFDILFYQLNDQYFNQLIYRNQKNYLDTIRKRTDTEFTALSHPVFQSHRETRFKTLEADMMRSGREKIMGSLKITGPDDWNYPGFSELLNTLFVNTLSNESKTITGTRIKQWIRDKNITEIKKWTVTFTSATSPLTELLLLKMLHDAFYSGEFSKPSILSILRSEGFMQNPYPVLSRITREVVSKLTYLEKGSTAPEICLPTLSGTKWCTTANTKPYQYILFADLDIPICREQVKYLKTMLEKTGEKLMPVLVVSPAMKTDIRKFFEDNQISGMILLDHSENPFAEKYKVRAFPSAFLLDKNHRIVLSSAKTPLDGFEFQFESVIKSAK
jgi:peroxiredoxin